MTWRGICACCGGPVTGGTDNGTLDIPAGGQVPVCLWCLCFGSDELSGEAGIPYLVKRELREAA